MVDTKSSRVSKSRTGCSECKRKRVKCDEARPTCSRCSRHPERCSYSLKLSWTQGRPFKKPRVSEKPWVIDLGKGSSEASTDKTQENNIEVGPSVPNTSQPESTNQGNWTISQKDVESLFVQSSQPQSPSAFNTFQITATTNDYDDDVLQSAAFINDSLEVENLVPNILGFDDSELIDEVVERNDMIVPFAADHWQSSVPQSLSTYPLLCPSEPPSAYFFLHHYITHTSGTLFPLLAPSVHQDVLSIASQTPHLLSAALALSCDQYRRLVGNDSLELQNRHNFFSRKAMIGLRQAMDDPNQAPSFPTICTVLFLCTNEVMSGNASAMRTHLRGAEQLLSLAIGKSRRASVGVLDEQKLFLIRWFAVVEIFSNIMSLDKTSTFDGQFWSVESPVDGSAHVDEFVGFSLELMPILARIGRMARLQQRRRTLGHSLGSEYAEMADDLDMLVADNILLTEQQLSHLFSRASSPSLEHGQDPVLALETQYTHQMFVHAALLHLYRRVQELPGPDPKPAHALASIVDLFQKLRPHSPANVLILWPLFTAGCEAEDLVLRSQIEACMYRLRNYGWGNVDAGLDAVKTYWAEGNGERWDVFLERRGFDTVLF